MNDERELRQLLFEKAGEPTTPTLPPKAVLRRSRLRQLRTVAGGMLASIAVVGLVAVQIGRDDSSTPADAEELAWSHEDGASVARGNDIGTDWELRLPDADPGTFRFSMGGSPAGTSFGLNLRSWAIMPAPAGSFLVATTTADIDHFDVQPHRGDLIRGRWLPEEVDGTEARYWVLPLPGSGSGEIMMGNELPVAISWPPSTRPGPGQVVISGGERGISWALHFRRVPRTRTAFSWTRSRERLQASRLPPVASLPLRTVRSD
jgi:hypothetical protein